jgi:beta-glucosidase
MDASAHDGQPGPEDLLARLSLEEKISLLTGADYWSLGGHSGIGLRPIRTSDGRPG